MFKVRFPFTTLGVQLTIFASATMPTGTLASLAIRPFSRAVALTPANATAIYQEPSAKASTTLVIANGRLTATARPAPGNVTALYSFDGTSGAAPVGVLVPGTNGVFYGATEQGGPSSGPYFGGTVFELTPASNNSWMENVLYNFYNNYAPDGPVGSPTPGPAGVLFDVTGTLVFELSPPAVAGMPWTETVLHTFGGLGDGIIPAAGLVQGPNGVLYGTTSGGGTYNSGTVYEMTPPAIPGGSWTETVLYSFKGQQIDGANPYAAVAVDTGGALYGTTAYGGTS